MILRVKVRVKRIYLPVVEAKIPLNLNRKKQIIKKEKEVNKKKNNGIKVNNKNSYQINTRKINMKKTNCKSSFKKKTNNKRRMMAIRTKKRSNRNYLWVKENNTIKIKTKIRTRVNHKMTNPILINFSGCRWKKCRKRKDKD